MIYFIFIVFGLLIANYGAKREIGFGWSFFFSIFFSPLIGWAIASDSPKIKGEIVVKEPTFWSQFFCIIFLGISGFLFYSGFKGLSEDAFGYEPLEQQQTQEAIWVFSLAIGFLGAAVYTSRIKQFRYKKEVEPEGKKSEDSKPPTVDELTIELRELLKNNDSEINKNKGAGL